MNIDLWNIILLINFIDHVDCKLLVLQLRLIRRAVSCCVRYTCLKFGNFETGQIWPESKPFENESDPTFDTVLSRVPISVVQSWPRNHANRIFMSYLEKRNCDRHLQAKRIKKFGGNVQCLFNPCTDGKFKVLLISTFFFSGNRNALNIEVLEESTM